MITCEFHLLSALRLQHSTPPVDFKDLPNPDRPKFGAFTIVDDTAQPGSVVTVGQRCVMRIWKIDPGKLTTNFIKDVFLTMSFVFTYRAGSRIE